MIPDEHRVSPCALVDFCRAPMEAIAGTEQLGCTGPFAGPWLSNAHELLSHVDQYVFVILDG